MQNKELQRIIELHGIMREHVTRVIHSEPLIKAEEWDRVLRNMDKWDLPRTLFTLRWLERLYEKEWLDIHIVWTKPNVNEEMWENYEWMFDEKDVLHEQKLLTAARRAFKKAFKQYKRELAELRRGAKKTTSKERPRSKATGSVEEIS